MNAQDETTSRPRLKGYFHRGFNDLRTQTPFLSWTGDPYYWLMEVGWLIFIAAVVLVFVVINLIFGTLYALIPGMIANAAPHSLRDGFFFSVDTLATVGYGNMYPSSPLGHAIASVEILLGLFFIATVTGLIFARFSRPRGGLVFSRYAVIGRYQGQRALMVRAIWTRSYPLLEARAQLSWQELVTEPDGRKMRRLRDLKLLRNHNPVVGLAWTLIHLLTDDSEILATLEAGGPLILAASVNGTDMLLANLTQSLQKYSEEDVLVDHEYADMVFDEADGVRLDSSRLDVTQPIAGSR
jgi:inward rectifier potassium channel